MVTVTNITFTPKEKLDELTVVSIEPASLEHKDARVHIQTGFLMMHMTIDQCIDFANALNGAMLPLMEARQKKEEGEINLEVGSKMTMKDSLH